MTGKRDSFDGYLNPFQKNQGNSQPKIVPMIVNNRNREANSLSPLRNAEGHIVNKYITKLNQENEKIINKYSFKKKQYYPYG